MYAVFKVQCWLMFYQPSERKITFSLRSLVKPASILIRISPGFLFLIWRPPALPHRLQCSTIGRLGLNRRVRDGNGCVPQPHRHQNSSEPFSIRIIPDWISKKLCFFSQSLMIREDSTVYKTLTSSSLERRWSSRTFRYGYLVTTSPQLSISPSAAPSLRLGHWLRAFPTPMVWRAVCTRPGNVFTAAFWSAITSDSSFV